MMTYTSVQDWSGLTGRHVQIRRNGKIADMGNVDAVTADGAVLWLESMGAIGRRLYLRDESYEAWGGPELRTGDPAVRSTEGHCNSAGVQRGRHE